MILKRIYHKDLVGPNGRPIVVGVKVVHPRGTVKHFTPEFVTKAVSQGWASLARGKFIIHAEGGDMVYKITREPGRWCCHCGAKLDDDAQGVEARKHVAAKHAGAASPDPEHPAGYECINYYDCTREEA